MIASVPGPMDLHALNAMGEEQFAAALGGIFENSPWIARRAAASRPFPSRLALLEALQAVIADATCDERLALIRAHPELAGKAAIRKELTAESGREQQGAGLHTCTPQEFARLHELNAAYREKFGFPFVLAVRGHNPASIVRACERRLRNELAEEQAVALREIGSIGGYRLTDLVASPPGAETMAMIDRLARFSERAGELTCSYLSAAHRAAASQIREWMLAAGLDVEIDAVGNVVGRLRCGKPGARTLMTGSHYDTVVDAGRYDGRLGVVLPIVVAADLRRKHIELPFDLEVLAFADEEGVRFKSTFIGSSAVAGCFDFGMLDKLDARGTSMRVAMHEAGLDPAGIPALARDRRSLLGYVEIHIEQGPVLLEAGRPLGVVTSIAGSVRYSVAVTGQAGHAGTVPMALRRDAATAAAEIVLAVERRCSGTPGLVGTVGCLEVPGGSVNVIPGRCDLTIDLRAADDTERNAALADVLSAIDGIAARRQVHVELRKLMEASATACAPSLQEKLAASIRRTTGDETPLHLPSGAGHDAMKMAEITGVGMLFVRCERGGISHHPDESVDVRDVALAARAFEDFLVNWIPACAGTTRSTKCDRSMNMNSVEAMVRNYIEREFARETAFLSELVRVPSDNPPGDCKPHADRACDLLKGLDLEVQGYVVPQETVRANGMISATNLIVRQRFGPGGPTIALNAHGDVVPPGLGWARDPYGAQIVDDPAHGPVMFGRGVAVSKADFATYTWALLALRELQARGVPLNGSIELHFTYDEETGGTIGPRWLIEQNLSRPDLAICAGFSYAVTTAHNGCLHLEAIVNGKAGHAAIPETGVDALEAATAILNALYAHRAELAMRRSAVPGIGAATLNVGLIHGGINTNVVPDRVVLRIDRRIIPEESVATAEAELRESIAAAAATRPGIAVEVRRILLAEPLVELPEAVPLVQALRNRAGQVFGTPIPVTGVPLYTDARHYARAGIPTVLYGAGPRTLEEANGHGPDECLRLNDLKRATLVVALALADLLGAVP